MPDPVSPGIIPSTGCSTLRRFFQQGVTAADIAEGLVTFDVDLLDCLQFADKGHIVGKDAGLRDQIGFVSRNTAKATVKALEQLRNRLAHAQDLGDSSSLETAVNLARHLDRVLELTSPVHRGRSQPNDEGVRVMLSGPPTQEEIE